MKPAFWFSADSQYEGPYDSLRAAKEAAVKLCKADEHIEIHQRVYVSAVPARTGEKV